MTHDVTSPPSIDALRKYLSYYLVGDGQKARQEHRAFTKRPSNSRGWDKLYLLAIQKRRRRGRDAADCGLAQKLGMSEYAQRFAENEIDISVLPDLTDQDLKDIGVPLGHRRKMLAAIAELAGVAPSDAAACRSDRAEARKTPPNAAKSR